MADTRNTTMIALRVNDDLLGRIDEARGPVPRAEFCRRLANEGLIRATGKEPPSIQIESGVLSGPNGRVVVIVGKLKDGRLNLFDSREDLIYNGVDIQMSGFIPNQP